MPSATADLPTFIAELRRFVAERDWAQFHDPKNLAMLLSSEVGELCAEYRWVAGAAADEHSRAEAPRARITDEIGDVGIALLLLCDRIGVDLLQAMSDKLSKNRDRYPVEASRGRAERPTP
ncbi:MAG TPA: nucleotide pyrophosphohydrolase [Polyangia bacterium]|nr:nucleotide pyrophosphohydrolase [Polyangia bacterium]